MLAQQLHCLASMQTIVTLQAFDDKIQAASHRQGCNCKKSGCMKRYCECFEVCPVNLQAILPDFCNGIECKAQVPDRTMQHPNVAAECPLCRLR